MKRYAYTLPFNMSSALRASGAETIRQLLSRINTAEHPFQIVTDKDGRLLGTVTDGDIRRALMRPDITTDTPVAQCMHKTPLTGQLGDEAANERKLQQLPGLLPFLPLIDGQGIVRSVLVEREPPGIPRAALVMAGGFGRRLGRRTLKTPKPLLEVSGKPILEHIVSRLEDIGIRKIFVSVHHLHEQIEAYISNRNNKAEFEFLYETVPLGTAGSIGLLPDDAPDSFIVINGDVLTHLDLPALYDMHIRGGNDATIAVAQHPVNIPYGVVRHTPEGLFEGIDEKPSLSFFVAAGVYLLTAPFRSLVPSGCCIDMPDLLKSGRSVGLRIGLFPVHEYWVDVGNPKDLLSAKRSRRLSGP